MSSHIAPLIVLTMGMLGCVPSDVNSPGTRDDTAGASDTSGTPLDDSADSAAEDIAAVWFTVGGDWTVTTGALATASLSFTAYPQDPRDGAMCSSLRETTPSRDLSSPDETIYHWWLVETGADDPACPQLDALPRRIIIGLGALHPEMAPALDRYDLESAGASLYGSYAALVEGGDVDGAIPYAFGFGGTSSDRSGQAPAVSMAPVPDGVYTVTPVYVFPLPGT